MNSLGRAERHGNRAGVDRTNWCADSLAWREGGKVGCQARSGQVGDLHKLRGIVTKLQQTETKQGARGQLGLARRGYGGMGQEQTKAARLGWREGAKARER